MGCAAEAILRFLSTTKRLAGESEVEVDEAPISGEVAGAYQIASCFFVATKVAEGRSVVHHRHGVGAVEGESLSIRLQSPVVIVLLEVQVTDFHERIIVVGIEGGSLFVNFDGLRIVTATLERVCEIN